MLSVCGLVGWAEGLAISKIAPVLAIGGLLGILHYIAHSLSANWWRKVMVAQRMPLTWWLAFSVWLIAPLALLIPPISPLAGFHGWLLPLTLMPTSLQQQISTSWFHGIRISLPHWSLMAIVQIAWAGLLWALERMSKLPQVQPEEKRREWLTVNHPLWGWLARLEEQLCEAVRQPVSDLATSATISGQGFARNDDDWRDSKFVGAEHLASLPHFPTTGLRCLHRRVANSLAQFGWACGRIFCLGCQHIARAKISLVAFRAEAGCGEFRVSAVYG
jgi:hypothetical protein